MNEFDNEYEKNEIERIQQEIDRDLNEAANSSMVQIETEQNSTVQNNIVQNDVVPLGFENNRHESFYTETVKNETAKNNKNKFKRTVAVACIVSILGGVSGGVGIGIGMPIAERVILPGMGYEKAVAGPSVQEEAKFTFSQGAGNVPVAETSGVKQAGGGSLSDLIDRVEPSVVAITSTIASSGFGGFSQFYNEPQQGAGSGIIFHEDAGKIYIATNYHVVGGANSVEISISNGEKMSDLISAKLVGRDPVADLAVISVEKTDLEKADVKHIVLANFGDSDAMKVGDPVLAIGNALGEGNSATDGIVSAKNKEINVQGKVLTVIQTNAAINPGNSGGALINLKGEVIGINTAKLSESTVEGMGYSITSNIAKPIIEDLMSAKPILGITGGDITEEMAVRYNLPQIGVLINSVVAGGSADKAGIKPYDIITVFNGETIFSMTQLQGLIKECKVGQEVEIKLLRNGKTDMTVTAKLLENSGTNF